MTTVEPSWTEHDPMITYSDPAGEYTMVVARPSEAPDLWREYLDGARRSYERHGCSAALDYGAVRYGSQTRRFYAISDRHGVVRGGLRIQVIRDSATQSHALEEWMGQDAQVAVVNAIESRLDAGIAEVKTAWVDEASPVAGAVAAQMARLAIPVMVLEDVRYTMATAAEHVLRRWESGGGRVDETIAPSPYPDDRYRTRLMWWDRASLGSMVRPAIWERMLDEASSLLGAHWLEGLPVSWSGATERR